MIDDVSLLMQETDVLSSDRHADAKPLPLAICVFQ
jgi:hypothetical protein